MSIKDNSFEELKVILGALIALTGEIAFLYKVCGKRTTMNPDDMTQLGLSTISTTIWKEFADAKGHIVPPEALHEYLVNYYAGIKALVDKGMTLNDLDDDNDIEDLINTPPADPKKKVFN